MLTALAIADDVPELAPTPVIEDVFLPPEEVEPPAYSTFVNVELHSAHAFTTPTLSGAKVDSTLMAGGPMLPHRENGHVVRPSRLYEISPPYDTSINGLADEPPIRHEAP